MRHVVIDDGRRTLRGEILIRHVVIYDATDARLREEHVRELPVVAEPRAAVLLSAEKLTAVDARRLDTRRSRARDGATHLGIAIQWRLS